MTNRATWTSFVSGALGESLEYRSELALYQAGVKVAENCLVVPQGPLIKRAGLKRLDDFDAAVRLIPFTFSTTQAYLFAMGNGELRVYKDGVEVANSIAIPYSDGALAQLRWTQSFDTWFGFHPSYQPHKIFRGGSHSSWTVSALTFDQYPTYRFGDAGAITLTPSATTGSITLTASAPLFTAGWVGEWIRFPAGGTPAPKSAYAVVTAFTDSTHVTASVFTAFAGTTASSTWEEQAFSLRRGWPVTGIFHQNRLIIGGTLSLPQTIFGSRIGLYLDYNPLASTAATPAIAEDDAFQFTLGSSDVNAILDFYSSNNALQVFTTSAEWVETSAPLTPTNVSFKLSTHHGMLNNGIRVISIDSDTLFPSRDGNQVRAFSYNNNSTALDAFTARNLSVAAPTMVSNPTDVAYLRGFAGTQANHGVFLNSDGSIALISIDTDQKVLGWSKFIFEGHTPEALCEVSDDLYVLTLYEGHKYICVLDTSDITYLDLWEADTNVSPTTAWTGFTAFANQTVSVEGDGYSFTDIAVNGSGNFTLPSAVSAVKVGLPYTMLIETLPLAPVIQGQLMRGERIRKIRGLITVRNTRDLWVDGRQIPLRSLGEDLLDTPISEKDQTYRVTLSGAGPEPTVTIESRLGKPLTLIGLILEFKCKTA